MLKNTTSAMQNQEISDNKYIVNLARLGIGLLQGVLLYFLWNEKNISFNPLLMITCFVPLILVHGIGNMRFKTLIIWSTIAAILIASLTYYDSWRLLKPVDMPSFHLFFSLIIILFIAHALIVAGDTDRKFMAHYSTYFDVAWKMCVQFTLAIAFWGIFWLLLSLGAGLFAMIKITFFLTLIQQPWFFIPVSTLTIALAFNITDVRPSLVRGVRTLILVLLSWLLPLIALTTAGFLCALIFTGFLPFWQTSHATILLLIAATSAIILINAAYQDGNPEKPTPKVLRYSARLASLTLVPTIAIAAYALSLRVGEYGWTVDRILIAFYILILAFYALGYMLAALKPGAWLQFIEPWNFIAALLISILSVALLTPIADPARLSVIDQIKRLEVGKISPTLFDFEYLRDTGERFGHQALLNLQQISHGSQAPYIRENATATLQHKEKQIAPNNLPKVQHDLTPQEIMQQLKVHTPTGQLPESFLKQNWRSTPMVPECLKAISSQCDVWLMDLKGDGEKEIIIFDEKILYGFHEDTQHNWKVIGFWGFYGCDPAVKKAVAAGQFKKIPPIWPDIQSLEWRIPFSPAPLLGLPACSTQTSEKP